MTKKKKLSRYDIFTAGIVCITVAAVVAAGTMIHSRYGGFYNPKLGDVVEVKEGFYRNCRGLLTARVPEGYVATMMCAVNGKGTMLQGLLEIGEIKPAQLPK